MKIIIRNLQRHIPINPKRIKLAVLKTLSLESIKKSAKLTICLVDDRQIRKLNLRYRGCGAATDVLSFDYSENKREISADIVVSTQTALRNARIFKTTPLYEMYLYIIHGLLHILGYDDETAKQKKIMSDKSEQILKTVTRNS